MLYPILINSTQRLYMLTKTKGNSTSKIKKYVPGETLAIHLKKMIKLKMETQITLSKTFLNF